MTMPIISILRFILEMENHSFLGIGEGSRCPRFWRGPGADRHRAGAAEKWRPPGTAKCKVTQRTGLNAGFQLDSPGSREPSALRPPAVTEPGLTAGRRRPALAPLQLRRSAARSLPRSPRSLSWFRPRRARATSGTRGAQPINARRTRREEQVVPTAALPRLSHLLFFFFFFYFLQVIAPTRELSFPPPVDSAPGGDLVLGMMPASATGSLTSWVLLVS